MRGLLAGAMDAIFPVEHTVEKLSNVIRENFRLCP